MSFPAGTRPSNFLIGWVCILEPEFHAAMDVLDESYGTSHEAGFISGNGDPNMYQLGRIGGHKVVINVPQSCKGGLLNASEIVSFMKSTFSYIRFVLLVGIGGGAPSSTVDVRLGDVVFGDSVIPYKKGKHTDFGFKIDADRLEPPQELLGAVTKLRYRLKREPPLEHTISEIADQDCVGKGTYGRPARDRLVLSSVLHQEGMCDCLQSRLEDVSNLVEREERLPGTFIQTHRGIIGSADQVLKNARERDRLSVEQKIICFEMEAAAVLRPTRSISIRGISDYADGHKNDDWHNYAAMAAAVCAKKLLITLAYEAVLNTTMDLTQEELTRRFEGTISRVERKLRTNESNITDIKEANDELQDQIRLLTDLKKEQKAEDKRTKAMLAKLDSFQKELEATVGTLQDKIELQRKQAVKSDYVTRKEWEELKDKVQKTKKDVDRLGAQEALATFGEVTDFVNKDFRNRHVQRVSEYLGFSSKLAGKLPRWNSYKSVGATSNTSESISQESLQSSGFSTPPIDEPLHKTSTGESSISDKQHSQSLRHGGASPDKARIRSLRTIPPPTINDSPGQSATIGNPPPTPPRPGVASPGILNRSNLTSRDTNQLTTTGGPSNSSGCSVKDRVKMFESNKW